MLSTNEKINNMKKSLLFIFLMAIGTAVFAQSYYFTNEGGDNLWNNPQNWDLGSVPNSSDHLVYIIGSYNVEVKINNAFCGYLSLLNGSSLAVKPNAKLTVSFPGSGPTGLNIQIGGTSTLTIDEGGILEYDGELKVGNTLIVNGKVVSPPPTK